MKEIIAGDKLCIHQCHSTTSEYRAAAAKLQKAIDDIQKPDELAKNDLAALEQTKSKLDHSWEQKVLDYACANIEERRRCAERARFLKRIAKTTGVDMHASLAALKEKLKDETWWQEVEIVLDFEME
jgi:hypothetical protein